MLSYLETAGFKVSATSIVTVGFPIKNQKPGLCLTVKKLKTGVFPVIVFVLSMSYVLLRDLEFYPLVIVTGESSLRHGLRVSLLCGIYNYQLG